MTASVQRHEQACKHRGGIGLDKIPAGYKLYKRTPSFDATTLPDGLKKDHATKIGVWGVITVEKGQLKYTIAGTEYTIAGTEPSVFNLDSETPGIVAPDEKHHVRIIGDGQFYVAFYREA